MFQKYCVVFQELFVVFADMGHRTVARDTKKRNCEKRKIGLLSILVEESD